jgi:adenylate cyclase class 1
MSGANSSATVIAGKPAARRPQTPRQHFLAISEKRLAHVRECLTNRQTDFLYLLPLLFHVNHSRLPGYISERTPCGVKDFSPGDACMRAAKKIARYSDDNRRAHLTLDIDGIYFMGSVGTIAHTEASDFDIWVCHASELDERGIADLHAKGRAIEKWAESLDLEVHFFVFDAPSFRSGNVHQLSSESSGSTQHALLLDEFYRSGILVAGLPPAWWSIPPEREAEYDSHVVNLHDHIDFGGIAKAPAEEFFGASLWQLYKSIQSPYKSVLKLLLMEVYANSYPNTKLLSTQFKRAIYDGETDANAVDPYVLMYRVCERHLRENNDPNRLELLRRSFYIKVGRSLSDDEGSKDWQAETLRTLVAEWQWDNSELALLDSTDAWKLETVREETRQLMNALTKSYRHLSEFARNNAEITRITQEDLAILGRKLYAAFERKAGKVELLNRGLSANLREHSVSIHHLRSAKGDHWMLFRGFVTPSDCGFHTPLERSHRLFELLAWCHFNGIMDQQTQIALHGTGSTSIKEIQGVLAALEKLYPGGVIPAASHKDLTQPARITAVAFFVNVGLLTRSPRLYGNTMLTTERTNPMSFGGLHENLFDSIDMIYANSWEEVFTFRYVGTEGLLECLKECIRFSTQGSHHALKTAPVHCFSSGYSTLITKRFTEILTQVSESFRESNEHSTERYCLNIEEGYYMLEISEGRLVHQHFPSIKELTGVLGQTNPHFRATVFDHETLQGELLPYLYRHNREDLIQVYIVPRSNALQVYILDECGSLFIQSIERNDISDLVEHYQRFFSSLQDRLKDQATLSSRGLNSSLRVVFMRVAWDEETGYQHLPIPSPEPRRDRNYFNLQVIASIDESGATTFTLYYEDREFSSIEFGNGLFDHVAQCVLAQRKSGHNYPIYITDLDLSPALVGEMKLQTATFLHYKRVIEQKLLAALAASRV